MLVTITCSHCHEQYEYDYIPAMDSPILGECEWCSEDMCENCQSKEDDDFHDDCLEVKDQEELE